MAGIQQFPTVVVGPTTFTGSSTSPLRVKYSGTTNHAASFNYESTTGTGSALNLVSQNKELSTLQVSGHEANKGTIKCSHVNAEATRAGDENAADYSFDLQGKEGAVNGAAGSKAQGIFGTKTTYDVFNDIVFTSTSKNISSPTAVFTKEDVGREVKNIPVGVKASGTDTISAFVSATEVTLAGEAAKETKTPAGVELGRNAGPWVTIRDPAKALMYRLKPNGVPEWREVAEAIAAPETGCVAIYVRNKELFAKLGAGAEKLIVAAL